MILCRVCAAVTGPRQRSTNCHAAQLHKTFKASDMQKMRPCCSYSAGAPKCAVDLEAERREAEGAGRGRVEMAAEARDNHADRQQRHPDQRHQDAMGLHPLGCHVPGEHVS